MTGEFSTVYLADPVLPELIRKLVPKPRLLLMLRDPLEQCVSAYVDSFVVPHLLPLCGGIKILFNADASAASYPRAVYRRPASLP